MELCCYLYSIRTEICVNYLLYIYFRKLAAIFDFQHTHADVGSISTSLFVLPDSEILGVMIGISLLSTTRAEMYDIPIYFKYMSAILSSNTPRSQTVFSLMSVCCLHSHWNRVAVMSTSSNKRKLLSISDK